MKDKKTFRSMNRDNSKCDTCLSLGLMCYQCYRFEYAEEYFEDSYIEDARHIEYIKSNQRKRQYEKNSR